MKLFKIIIIFVFISSAFFGGTIFENRLSLEETPTCKVSKYEPDRMIEVSQCSMSDYGFRNGHTYPLYHKSKYLVNDIIGFTCHSAKCDHALIKRIDKIKTVNGEKCYYVMGNTDSYKCPVINPDKPDTIYDSFDSRSFGWLCGDEIDIEGVVYR